MTDFRDRRVTMVDTQVRPSDVTKFPIIEAMLAIPREVFVPEARREAAYVGENVEIAPGRVVLDPRTLAKMLDALDVRPVELVLDVGCGLGYSAAVVARLAEAVVAVEDDAALVAEAQARLAAESVDNVAVVQGPLAAGSAKYGPFDVITIEGGVEEIPAGLVAQLKEGGRIAAIFMTGALGEVKVGYKIDGALTWRYVFNASAPVLPGFARPRTFVL